MLALPSLSSLGLGALLASVALPLLAWLARSRVRTEPASVHRAQLAALGGGLWLLLVPSFWWLVPDAFRPRAPYYALELHTTIVRLANDDALHEQGLAASLSLASLLGACWLLAVALAALRVARGWLALRSVVASAGAAPQALTALLEERASELQVRAPELRIAQSCAIPFVFGLVRPVLVLPHELASTLDSAALALVLEHELEHVRRGDLRASALISALQVALGGHPTAQRLAREAMLAREVAVDARVSRSDPRAYASLLVDIAAHAQLGERLAATAIDDTALARRIALIAEPGPSHARSSAHVHLAAALIAVLACYARGVVDGSPLEARPVAPLAHGFGVERGLTIAGVAHGPTRMFFPKPGKAFRGAPPPPFGPSLPHVRGRTPEVRSCYQRAASGDPSLTVGAMFELALDERGKVTAAAVRVPDLPSLEPCLAQAVLALPAMPEHEHPARVIVSVLLGPDPLAGQAARPVDTLKLNP